MATEAGSARERTVGELRREKTTSQPAVVCRDLHLTYAVYGDGYRPTMRRLVSRRFQPRPLREVNAVRGISFTIHRGEALGIIGRNGAGKSTLLRVIAGLLPPTAGEVYAREKPVLLGVAAALHPELSGRRNIFLGGTALGMARREIEERFDEIVEFAGLADFIDMPFRTYSTGMQQRLQFSVATAIEPDVLLVDEALSVGDEEFKHRSEERMQELLAKAGAVCLVSHSLSTILEICSRVIWLHDGVVREDGDPQHVVDTYKKFAGGG